MEVWLQIAPRQCAPLRRRQSENRIRVQTRAHTCAKCGHSTRALLRANRVGASCTAIAHVISTFAHYRKGPSNPNQGLPKRDFAPNEASAVLLPFHTVTQGVIQVPGSVERARLIAKEEELALVTVSVQCADNNLSPTAVRHCETRRSKHSRTLWRL